MLVLVIHASAFSPNATTGNLRAAGAYMKCGSAPLCGILTLETGLGSGYYKHQSPGPHGLWPEVDTYGSSACIKPSGSSADPSRVYACYADGTASSAHQLDFEAHEWEKHGMCAGVVDADDFFSQICSLARAPIAVMTRTRSSGATAISDYSAALQSAGYPVYDSDSANSQVMLSSCAGSDGKWKIAAVDSFSDICRGTVTSPPPPATPSPSGECLTNVHGPPCHIDADCAYKGCVRCAHSGYCTNVPL